MLNNIGDILKKTRHELQLTLEDVEKETKIRKKNLVAIESENWEAFPSRTYVQGIIRSYGNYLKLDENKLLAYFRREYEKRDQLKFKQRAVKEQFRPQAKKNFKRLIILIILIFVSYFGYQLKLYYSPPEITITSPVKSVFNNEKKITLKGKTEKDTIVEVNGERVFLDKNNFFTIEIPLSKEKNTVVIKATGANGQKTVVERIFEKKK